MAEGKPLEFKGLGGYGGSARDSLRGSRNHKLKRWDFFWTVSPTAGLLRCANFVGEGEFPKLQACKLKGYMARVIF